MKNLFSLLFISLCASSGLAAEYLIRVNPHSFRSSAANVESVVKRTQSTVLKKYEIVPGLMRVNVSEKDAQKTLEALKKELGADYVVPNYVRRVNMGSPKPPKPKDVPAIPAFVPQPTTWKTDPKESLNYGTSDYQSGTRLVWKNYQAIGHPDTIIAVLDTGIDYTHPDLVANLWRNPGETGVDSQNRPKETNGVDDDENGYIDDVVGYDFAGKKSKPYDDHNHGTHVAGIAAAVGGNGVGIAGHCPRCSIMGLKFMGANGSGTDADAIEAIEYAVKMKATVINSSWGSDEYNPALEDAFKAASQAGVLNVVAAGNDGKNLDLEGKAYPAEFKVPGLITVAALYETSSSGMTPWSNYGRNSVHVSMGGADVYSTTPGNTYQSMSGTSMASPGVAGCVGLIKSHYPHLSFDELTSVMSRHITSDQRSMSRTIWGGRLDMPEIFEELSKK
ncbi:MAG: S8 family peptidase [Bdellovibrionales bacterium]